MTTQQPESPVLGRRFPNAYLLPIIHLFLCLIGLAGYVIPSLSFFGVILEFINLADLPISIVGIILSFHHDTIATLWILVVGTLWWYLLSRLIGRVTVKPKPNGSERAA
jgi:hypothetical protein